MAKVFLNEDGLRKLLPYLEAKLPGLTGKLVVQSNYIKIIDEDFEIFVRIPKPVNEQVDVPTPGVDQPSMSQPAGKGVQTDVERLGRAASERDEEETFNELLGRLSKHFPTRQEFDKFLQSIKGVGGQQPKDLASAFGQLAATIKQR
jgi:hypothetical protein